MRDSLRRWSLFAGSVILLLAVIFIVLPAGKRVPLMGTMLEHNAKSGINVAGFVYTDVERVLVLSHELVRNSRRTGEDGPFAPVPEISGSNADLLAAPKQQE